MSRTKKQARDDTAFQMAFEVRGAVPEGMVQRADAKLTAALRHASEPVLFARVRLSTAADPAVERPAMAQANLDVNGRPVRARAAGASMAEAIDLLHDRVVARLDRVARHWEAIRGGRPKPGPHEWKHGAERAHRPDHYPRPVGEREITRRKTFTPARQTPDEAAFDMDVMDYDFHLFTDAETGRDSVLYRTSGGYRLSQVGPPPQERSPSTVALSVSPHPAARLDVEQAVERLELAGLPFVFFADATTGRGNVLYHRYDGHYGLITPTV